MNIFVLSDDPVLAASMMCDKHVVKMIVESSQILSTSLSASNCKPLLKPTHHHHPCVVWACATKSNFSWLLEHFKALQNEYTKRYGKFHKYSRENHYEYYAEQLKSLPDGSLHPFVQCMPEEYRGLDAVEAYRRYYMGDKAYFAKWRYSEQPDWWSLK